MTKMIRVYDTPTHYHIEPKYDPFFEDKMIEQYGENWEQVLLNWEL